MTNTHLICTQSPYATASSELTFQCTLHVTVNRRETTVSSHSFYSRPHRCASASKHHITLCHIRIDVTARTTRIFNVVDRLCIIETIDRKCLRLFTFVASMTITNRHRSSPTVNDTSTCVWLIFKNHAPPTKSISEERSTLETSVSPTARRFPVTNAKSDTRCSLWFPQNQSRSRRVLGSRLGTDGKKRGRNSLARRARRSIRNEYSSRWNSCRLRS